MTNIYKTKKEEQIMKFYKCDICGNILYSINDNGVIPVCCGQTTHILIPNTTEADKVEKHLPIITKKGNEVTVTISSTIHPSMATHYIEWIILETDKGHYKRDLSCQDTPIVTFTVNVNEKVKAAYAYCNIHGLWGSNYENK